MTIEEQQQQISQAKQQLQQAQQQLSSPYQYTQTQLMRGGFEGQVARQQFEQNRATALQQVQPQLQQVQAYENQFNQYLTTPSGILQYAEEKGIQPTVKEETKSYMPKDSNTLVPYNVTTKTYTTPYGSYTTTESDLKSQIDEVNQSRLLNQQNLADNQRSQLFQKYLGEGKLQGFSSTTGGLSFPEFAKKSLLESANLIPKSANPITYFQPNPELSPTEKASILSSLNLPKTSPIEFLPQPYQQVNTLQVPKTNPSFLDKTLNFAVTPIPVLQGIKEYIGTRGQEKGFTGSQGFIVPAPLYSYASQFIPVTPLDIGLSYGTLKYWEAIPQLARIPAEIYFGYTGTKTALSEDASVGERLAGGVQAGLSAFGLVNEPRVYAAKQEAKIFEKTPITLSPDSMRINIGNSKGIDYLSGTKQLPSVRYFASVEQPFFNNPDNTFVLEGGKGVSLRTPLTSSSEKGTATTFESFGRGEVLGTPRVVKNTLTIRPNEPLSLIDSMTLNKETQLNGLLGSRGKVFVRPTGEGTFFGGNYVGFPKGDMFFSGGGELSPVIKPKTTRENFAGISREFEVQNPQGQTEKYFDVLSGKERVFKPSVSRDEFTYQRNVPIKEVSAKDMFVRGAAGTASSFDIQTRTGIKKGVEGIRLVEGLTPEERATVLGHELGHIYTSVDLKGSTYGVNREAALEWLDYKYKGDIPKEYLKGNKAIREYLADLNSGKIARYPFSVRTQLAENPVTRFDKLQLGGRIKVIDIPEPNLKELPEATTFTIKRGTPTLKAIEKLPEAERLVELEKYNARQEQIKQNKFFNRLDEFRQTREQPEVKPKVQNKPSKEISTQAQMLQEPRAEPKTSVKSTTTPAYAVELLESAMRLNLPEARPSQQFFIPNRQFIQPLNILGERDKSSVSSAVTPINALSQRELLSLKELQQEKEAQKEEQAVFLGLSPIQREVLKQAQVQKQTQRLKSELKEDLVLVDTSKGFAFGRTGFSFGIEKKKKLVKRRTSPNYVVLERRRGQFLPVGRASNIQEASMLGLRSVKSNLGASFIIKSNNQLVKPYLVSPELRTSKRNPFILVQRQRKILGQGSRLGTIQERRELQNSRRKRRNVFF